MPDNRQKEGELSPFGQFNFPSLRFGGFKFPSLFEEFGENFPSTVQGHENLTVSEDETKFYVEAALPGLSENEIEASVDDNILWIRGTKKEEESDKKKKFYRKASRSFSYSIALPKNIDHTKEPDADFKDGLMIITFPKEEQKKSKRISIKRS